jgi:hypothetical protein
VRWWKGGHTVIRVCFIADCANGTRIILSPRVGHTLLIIYAELIFVAVCAYEAVNAASPRTLRIISRWLKIHTSRPVTYGIWGTRCGLIRQADGSVCENNTHAEVGIICADNAGLTSGICSGRCGKKCHKQHLMASETHEEDRGIRYKQTCVSRYCKYMNE